MNITETYKKNIVALTEAVKRIPFDEESQARIIAYANDPTSVLNEESKRILELNSDSVSDYRIELPFSSFKKEEIPEVSAVYNTLLEILFETEEYEVTSNLNNSCFYTNKFTYKRETRKTWKFLKSKIDFMVEKIYSSVKESHKIAEKNEIIAPFAFISAFGIKELALGSIYKNLQNFIEQTRETSLTIQIKEFLNDPNSINFNFYFDERDKEVLALLKKSIATALLKNSEVISSKILSSKSKYKLYVSFNVFDYIMCSTKENWTSCLSLSSGHCYGTGLLGLSGCPDAAVIFISNSEKVDKSEGGFVVPNMESRAWMFYTSSDFYGLIKWYPNDISESIDLNILKNIGMNVKNIDEEGDSYDLGIDSKNSWKPLTFKSGQIAWIYTDYYKLHGRIKDEVPEIFLTFGDCQYLPKCVISENGNLMGLRNEYSAELAIAKTYGNIAEMLNAENGKTISKSMKHIGINGIFNEDYEDDYDEDEDEDEDEDYQTCPICGNRYPFDNLILTTDGEYVCEDCIDRSYVHCDICDCYEREENSYYIEGEGIDVCEDCYSSNFSECSFCGESIRNDDIIEVYVPSSKCNHYYCEDCLSELNTKVINGVLTLVEYDDEDSDDEDSDDEVNGNTIIQITV